MEQGILGNMTSLWWDGLAAGAEQLPRNPSTCSFEWPMRPEVTLRATQEIYLLAPCILPEHIVSTALFISAISRSSEAGAFVRILDKMAPPAAPAAAAAQAQTESGMSVSRDPRSSGEELANICSQCLKLAYKPLLSGSGRNL